MDPFTLTMGVGTAFSIFANYGANVAQSAYETENARFYLEQADVARAAMERELAIASRSYANQSGAIISGYATQGLDVGSGSMADVIGSLAARKMEELAAIKKQGELQIKLASSRGMRAQREADTLESFSYNFMQAGTTLLTNASAYERVRPGGLASLFSSDKSAAQVGNSTMNYNPKKSAGVV